MSRISPHAIRLCEELRIKRELLIIAVPKNLAHVSTLSYNRPRSLRCLGREKGKLRIANVHHVNGGRFISKNWPLFWSGTFAFEVSKFLAELQFKNRIFHVSRRLNIAPEYRQAAVERRTWINKMLGSFCE